MAGNYTSPSTPLSADDRAAIWLCRLLGHGERSSSARHQGAPTPHDSARESLVPAEEPVAATHRNADP